MLDALYDRFVFNFWSRISWKATFPQLVRVYGHVGENHVEVSATAAYLLYKSPRFYKGYTKKTSVYMIEPNDEKFDVAKKYIPTLQRVKRELTELQDLPQYKFSSVGCSFVLENLKMPKEERFEYIKQLRHLLAPSGILFGIILNSNKPDDELNNITQQDLETFFAEFFRKNLVHTYGDCITFWADVE